MPAKCIIGTSGLPIKLSGPITDTQYTAIKTTSSINLNSAPRNSPPSYLSGFIFDEPSSTSIYLNGETYSLLFVKIFKTFHSDQYFKNGSSPIAEMALWYKSSSGKFLLTCVPIYTAANNNNGGKYIEAALNISTDYKGSIGDVYIPTSSSLQYEACIKYGYPANVTDPLGLYITCIVFNEGIEINSEVNTLFTTAKRTTPLDDFGVPAVILPNTDYKTANVDWEGAFGATVAYDQSTGNNRKVYYRTISTGLDTFSERFRYYKPTITLSDNQKRQKNFKDTSAYKCIPINTKKDLVMMNGKLVVNIGNDEITGAGTLSDIVENQKIPDEQKGTNIASYVAIVIGGTAGIALASGFLWLGFRLIIRR